MGRVSAMFFVNLILQLLLLSDAGKIRDGVDTFKLIDSAGVIMDSNTHSLNRLVSNLQSLPRNITREASFVHDPIYQSIPGGSMSIVPKQLRRHGTPKKSDFRKNHLPGKFPDQNASITLIRKQYLDIGIPEEHDSKKKRLTHAFHGQSFFKSNIKRKRLRIGVPARYFKQFVEVNHDHKRMTEFPIDVFDMAVRTLSYKLIPEKVPFNGSYDDLLKEVALKTFDAAVGDIVITAEGYEMVDFSQPYGDVELKMVVTTEIQKSLPWLFMRPFTWGMWFAVAAMSVFTGFVVWLIEQQNHNESGDSSSGRQIGTFLPFYFGILYHGQRESPRSNLSHFVLAPWLFLMLVVTSTFMTSLTSMMINSQSEPSTMDVNVLKRTNAVVGCDGNPIVIKYLVKDLGFKPENIRSIVSIDDHAKALSSGNIKAAFILTPHAKTFLAKYCRGFDSGPSYMLGSFGFVFQKGSSLAADMSQAILRLRELGELQLIEQQMLSYFKCSPSPSDANMTPSLGPGPFLGLFIISGGASAIALLITAIRRLRQHWDRVTDTQAALMGRQFWMWVVTLVTKNQTRNELQLARRSSSPETGA